MKQEPLFAATKSYVASNCGIQSIYRHPEMLSDRLTLLTVSFRNIIMQVIQTQIRIQEETIMTNIVLNMPINL